jgi:pilus assembly protein Flp/PilA
MPGDASGNQETTMKLFKAFLNNEGGATAIEYALIAASISIVIVVAATSVGSSLNLTFTNVSNGLH